MTKRKLALIGVGKIAQDQHVPAISDSPDWELAATVSREGEVEGVEHYDSLSDMFAARPDIGTVSLCLPPVPRFEFAAEALKAGRHVMLEKPPGASLAECYTLEAMARAAGLSLYATWHSREADQVDTARDWLKTRQVRRFSITWKEDVRRWHPGQDWIFDPGGMGVFDPGINALSILTKIMPQPLHVTKAVLEIPENRYTPVAVDLQFFYPGAEEATAVFNFLEPGQPIWNIDVETDNGRLRLMDGGARLQIDGEEKGSRSDNPLKGEYPRLYSRMASLISDSAIDMDLIPMIQVADAFALGERKTVASFDW